MVSTEQLAISDLPPYHIENVRLGNPHAESIIRLSISPNGDILYFVSEPNLLGYLNTLSPDERETQKLVSDDEARIDVQISNLIITEIHKIIRKHVISLGYIHLSNRKLFEQIAILGSGVFTQRRSDSDFDITISISRELNGLDSEIIYQVILEMINSGFLGTVNQIIEAELGTSKKLNSLDIFIWYLSSNGYWEAYRPIYL